MRKRQCGRQRYSRRRHGPGQGGKVFLAFLLPSLFGVMVFVLAPFLDVIRRSFMTATGDRFTGFENYKIVFGNEAFLLAVRNTLRFTAVCLPLLIVLSLAAALFLTSLRNAQLFKTVFLLPMAMPAAAVVLVWKICFSTGGFLNKLLSSDTDYMDTGAAFLILVFSYLWKNFGYTLVLWMAGILAIPQDTMEAAKVDGAGKGRIFLSVMLPQLKGVLFTITVLSFLNSFKVFREAYLVAGPYPHESMYLLQHLFNNWFSSLDLHKMAAAAVCIALVLLAAILVLQRLWDEGEDVDEGMD